MSGKLPDIKTKFPEWYQEVVYQAELADQSPVRGCIVIRPYGNDIWEGIKNILDKKIKDTGHKNAIFPLLIPESFLKKEAKHVEGFAPELAVVTHAGGKKLAEPLVVRPTSETMIHYMFAQWIKSWRDLPLKINQWANVVRWEMRPRAFLRTSEFFWQEGHTAHATEEEAREETLLMLNHYKDLAENYLAIPVVTGKKSEGEKFPGANATYTFEAFMPDGKALQMGTSHMLSQNFSKSFDMKYQDKEGNLSFPWLTSWGVTTRLIGSVVMAHGDGKGLVLPPKIAPIEAVIIPIYRTEEEKVAVLKAARKIADDLDGLVRVHVDDDDQKKPGSKFFHWEMKGVPFRMEIGPRDLKNNQAVIASRLGGDKEIISFENIVKKLPQKLVDFQNLLFERAQKRLRDLWEIKTKLEDIVKVSEGKVSQTGFCGTDACERLLKPKKLSIRCVLSEKSQTGCFGCEKKSVADVVVARSY
jgi:prolyl-tRNA synthetase